MMHVEMDPFGKNPKSPGSKLDAGKPKVVKGFIHYFPRAIMEVAKVSEFGATKYAWNGWEDVPDGVERYMEAEARHIIKQAIEGELDSDSKLMHMAHEAWNAMAKLELALRSKEADSKINGS